MRKISITLGVIGICGVCHSPASYAAAHRVERGGNERPPAFLSSAVAGAGGRSVSGMPEARDRPAAPKPFTGRVAGDGFLIAQASQFRDGTYPGSTVSALFGDVQVQAIISNGKVVAVKALRYPNDRQESRVINDRALPLLETEAIHAQAASVDVVSGATLTSKAYRASLGSALGKARF